MTSKDVTITQDTQTANIDSIKTESVPKDSTKIIESKTQDSTPNTQSAHKKLHALITKIKTKYHKILATLDKIYHDFTDKDKIFLYAASLSFYTIFSIIPLCLMLFSVFSSFPTFMEHIETFKQTILANILPDSTQDISNMLDSFLTNGKEMGFLGFLVALFSSFIFFRSFDDISARIFTAKKRSYFDSFIIYWLLITLIPLFVVTSIYFNTIISDKYSYLISSLYSFMPMLSTWLSFGILFRIAANKSLKMWVLLLSSFVGALAWYCSKIAFFYYMSYNKFYSNIYGSMSIIMFVFLWIYISWLVVLISMRLCKILDSKFSNKPLEYIATQDFTNHNNLS
ncbi:YihY family inner membrane protein [Helicobacter saguini]|uniref:YihY family inner membrane protein n=1 Tax=Helicobacter saguini TaxID=1548018 RepID=A0A347VHA7_9HELI|nr:YihY family inner membrane protein [Helicobacter saguini]MWV62217.1 YihY family inner membrane protein [Helicobacter saguini]MWV67110.1 YihY family inner membrane protein [Helicobacter saguini]MWV69460.1 YihY family inner membrane protein [Helicobacter saguini]MWV70987.1 YihY family inner membrane protein [Helicobacter saguini]TLD92929.1 YihY family inner membrane protein [Helicobacter saguini]